MTFKKFTGQLAITSTIFGLVVAVLYALLPASRPHLSFAGWTLLFFTVISFVLFFAARHMGDGAKGDPFLRLVMASVFGKMVVSLAFLGIYKKMADPPNTMFVIIFLLAYAIFTYFEVVFLTKLGKQ